MTHIMFDLETWGVTPGSDIRSIGAVVFDPLAGTLGAEFYVNVSGGARHGLIREPETVKFWDDQPEDTVALLLESQVPMAIGLAQFAGWLEDHAGTDLGLWSHGPHFDEAILAAVYRAAGQTVPWGHRAPRDTRTIYEAAGWPSIPFQGVQHYALDDARHQARVVNESYRRLLAPRELLAESGELFRFYEASHRAKPATDDTISKAERNAEIAGRIEGLLAA
ncbi:3'-5' exonuclease [Novosphingobium resinovorum]|uniref:3'-5' exoribonuclease Rv2179c-like domain-containing protein n=1 Tax=Novosphingobium resinovorum TaxID=158500 RepID=A0A1D8A356_9SPHN|nr:3'-5' exonuclease [Novosphingobium resinovorum]AOR76539.1 hypothetical protein BES08_07115 [Novosphingobium resinovorum]